MRFELSKDKNQGLIVAAVIFGLMAIVQLVRIVTGFSLVVNGQSVPLVFNMVGLVVLGFMSFWMFHLRNRVI